MARRETIKIFGLILLRNSMEQSPFLRINKPLTSLEIPHILWNPKVHYSIHESPSPVPILRELVSYQRISPSTRLCDVFRNIVSFYGEEYARSPNPKLKDRPLSAVHECLFNIQADPRIRGCSYQPFTAARKKKFGN